MRERKVFRYLWVISLFVVAGLSCNLVSNVSEAVQMKDTVVPMITDVGGMMTDIPMGSIETQVGSIATEFQGGGMDRRHLLAQHDPGGQVHEVHLQGLADEGHRAGGPQVALDDHHPVVPCQELKVHGSRHPERPRHLAGDGPDPPHRRRVPWMGREGEELRL